MRSLPIVPEKVLRALEEKERLRQEEYSEPEKPLHEWWPKDLDEAPSEPLYSTVMGQEASGEGEKGHG